MIYIIGRTSLFFFLTAFVFVSHQAIEKEPVAIVMQEHTSKKKEYVISNLSEDSSDQVSTAKAAFKLHSPKKKKKSSYCKKAIMAGALIITGVLVWKKFFYTKNNIHQEESTLVTVYNACKNNNVQEFVRLHKLCYPTLSTEGQYNYNKDLLEIASRKGYKRIVDILFKGINGSQINRLDQNLAGDATIAREYIEKVKKVWVRSYNDVLLDVKGMRRVYLKDNSPSQADNLYAALHSENHNEVGKLVHKFPALINQKIKDNKTPIEIALGHKDEKSFIFFLYHLQLQAPPHLLHQAVALLWPRAVELILKKRPRLKDIVDTGGYTPLDRCFERWDAGKTTSKLVEITDLLIQYKGRCHQPLPNLSDAVDQGRPRLLHLLLRYYKKNAMLLAINDLDDNNRTLMDCIYEKLIADISPVKRSYYDRMWNLLREHDGVLRKYSAAHPDITCLPERQ